MVQITTGKVWQQLTKHRRDLVGKTLTDMVLADDARRTRFEIAFEGLRFNYAMNFVTDETLALLSQLAVERGVAEMRARLYAGEKINCGENRAVLHTALRVQGDQQPVMVDGIDAVAATRAVRQRMAQLDAEIRSGKWLGATGKKIRHIVNIGIGGSDLGPRMVVRALTPYVKDIQAHFVANADIDDLNGCLATLDPAETLFIVVSKTFMTQETLLNANSARRWLVAALGEAAVAKHFLAVSTNATEVGKFGIAPENTFPLWDWVGGRFSLWSAVGLSICLAIGAENFNALLRGAAAMDTHFRTAPVAQNMPMLLGLLGVWEINFLGARARAVLPYCELLGELPRYLQQLDMESNGKCVTRASERVDYPTAQVIFGECGTVGQHSFHQLLHQGTELIPADFIGVSEDRANAPAHHQAMISNMVAQSGALAFGQSTDTPVTTCMGNRPSNLLLLDRLDPYRLGLLIALYEHKIFVQGIVWDINSFDQPGVELGKNLARRLSGEGQFDGKTGDFLAALYRSASRASD